ncbi:MmgE/PrpD family protein, partial [Hydrogenophaga sp.]|uniref:MmgE/PrpD family protein n=1 Tax=Hydrogenophaga sp. TaxID=1904254 RepID=UPI00286DFA62
SAMTVQDIPESVRRQARLCILDTVGCALAGTRTEEARLALACEPASADEAATVFGTPHRRSLQGAVRINGYLGDVLELNDLIGGHASIGNVTAALALGEVLGAPSTRVLEAVVRGIEVTTRVYEAVYPTLRRYTEMALVPVGIPSCIGS